jgi:AraC-like DNA-binding protein
VSEAIEYLEICPSPALARFVRCVWHLSGPASTVPQAQPIVPDGCVEIVLNLGDPFLRVNGAAVAQPAAMVVGQITGPVVVIPTGVVDVWGVRLQPWGAAAFLAIPSGELRETIVELDAVARSLTMLASEVQDGQRRARAVMSAVERWVQGREPPDTGVRAAVELITRAPTLPSVRSVGMQLGRSTRWVQRAFRDAVGLSPKMLTRINRVQRAMRAARLSPTRTWSSIAADVGYFDQSHLVRDFRQLVGCTPSEFSVRDGAITDAFIEA